jgi:hypothetical protein
MFFNISPEDESNIDVRLSKYDWMKNEKIDESSQNH